MRSILSNDPHNMMAQIKIAQIALQSGRREEAGRLLKDAVAANPDQSLPALTLARFDMQQGHLEDAATVVADYLNKDPRNADARAMQGELQLASGKPDQAVTTFRQLASTNPKSPQVQLLLATALAKAGKPEEATSAYRQAAQLAPMMQAAHLGLIQLALANKKDAEALVAAQSYAEKQPGPASASALARTYLALSRIGDAVKVLSDTQAKYPNDETLISLTSLLRKQGDANAADTMLTDWITKYPEDIAVRMAYGESQLATNSAVAEAQYRAVLKSQPYNLAALNNLSWLLLRNDPKQALPYAERAAKMVPNSADVLDTLGWTRWQLNDKDGAVSLLQRAHAAQPKTAEITFHLVIALDGTGRRADAKAMLDDLLASQQNFANKNEAEALAAKWQ